MHVVHRLHRQEDGELLFGLLFRHRQAKVERAAVREEVFEHLVDRVLIHAGPAGDQAANRLPDFQEEPDGRHVAGVLRRVGEEPLQIAGVEIRMIDTIMPALLLVMPAQGGAQPPEGVDLFGGNVDRGLTHQGLHEPIDVLKFLERRPSGIA